MTLTDHLNVFGVMVIQLIQYNYQDFEGFFSLLNTIFHLEVLLDLWFPVVCCIDSVFASQLLLCLAFGGWLTTMMKWWLLDDRPYWWVQETSIYLAEPYQSDKRPLLRQTYQTCEVGPGSPSEHAMAAVVVVVLFILWLTQIAKEKIPNTRVWSWIILACAFSMNMFVVIVARAYTASHFPHQLLLGGFIGATLVPTLCVLVVDPYLWQYGALSKRDPVVIKFWFILAIICMVAISVLTYYGLKVFSWDPAWSIKMAYRYCHHPENISRDSMPIISLLSYIAYMFGWAICVSPEVTHFAYNTERRSRVFAFLIGLFFMKTFDIIKQVSCHFDIKIYYLTQFILIIFKSFVYLRFLPDVSHFPYMFSNPCKVLVNSRKA
ncbi:unnamed protein product [Chrysodeixis includens]|uniref:glucose-6-phosphatase n=1 Tax=Chrysodeixis includens TaxID=689277 RepID=A0A9P0FXQ0_CHRIL|nr:unnamed protein product [Chrysodeixis includens]